MIFFLTKIQLYWNCFRDKNFDSHITLLTSGILYLKKGKKDEGKKKKHNNCLCFTDREIEVIYITDSRKWSIIKCHCHSIVHHKGRMKKLMYTAQLNELGIVKIYNRSEILLVPDKSSFFSAISTCKKKRLNSTLLSYLIALFKKCSLEYSFFKKVCFQQSDKKGVLCGFFW